MGQSLSLRIFKAALEAYQERELPNIRQEVGQYLRFHHLSDSTFFTAPWFAIAAI